MDIKYAVYKIYCIGNRKSYIGITDNIKRRFAVHWNDAFTQKKETVLCRSIRKYGKHQFIVSIFDFTDTWEDACKKEQHYIKKFNTKAPHGMNMTDGGEGITGHNHSDKTKDKMRQSHLGKGVGLDNPMYGKPGTMLGKKFTDEHRRKLSESCMRIRAGEDNGFAKLTDKDIISIRLKFKNECVYATDIAKEFNVGSSTIGRVLRGDSWKHIKEHILTEKEIQELTYQRMSIKRKGLQEGVKHSQATLTENDVLDIRRLYKNKEMNQPQLAKRYGLTQSNISCIVRRKSWAHI